MQYMYISHAFLIYPIGKQHIYCLIRKNADKGKIVASSTYVTMLIQIRKVRYESVLISISRSIVSRSRSQVYFPSFSERSIGTNFIGRRVKIEEGSAARS